MEKPQSFPAQGLRREQTWKQFLRIHPARNVGEKVEEGVVSPTRGALGRRRPDRL